MKILLIDDDPRQANLMARVLQRLGHDTNVAIHHNDALNLARGNIDAVITDIDMPGMNGVELAKQIRLRVSHMAIAFTATSSVKTSVLVEASQLGPVLPELWTVTDLKDLVAALGTDRNTLFQTTNPRIADPWAGLADDANVPELIDTAIGSDPVVTRTTRRVRSSFKRWSQVEGLCDRWSEGPVRMVMRLDTVAPRQLLSVVLALPDGTTMIIEGEVREVRDERGSTCSAVVELIGLTPERVACLHTMCHQLAEGTQCSELPVSDIISGNIKLRSQIEQLASKMVPK